MVQMLSKSASRIRVCAMRLDSLSRTACYLTWPNFRRPVHYFSFSEPFIELHPAGLQRPMA